jgi:hypothetical protein
VRITTIARISNSGRLKRLWIGFSDPLGLLWSVLLLSLLASCLCVAMGKKI